MCGFAAVVGPDAVAAGRIERGLAAIRHRGPDGEAVWRAGDGRAALAHARLAIIDLSSAGAQPMTSGDGRAVIAYNGEVYNFREIGRPLGDRLRSHSDTEVVLELLRHEGVRALEKLRGMFAFAYWDGQELLLVRDRLGIKPLYFSHDQEHLIAASELPAVRAMLQSPAVIDGRAIDDYLTYLYVPHPRTGIRGVRELEPGHYMRWRPGWDPKIERYWTLPSTPEPGAARPEAVRERLADSVRSHLVSDAPIGVFLSGGLDSSSIVALASEHYPGQLKTFSVTFGDEGKYLDERTFARAVASRFGTDHHEIQAVADVSRILPELVGHFGQPFGNPTAVLTYALAKETRQHVKVALAGDGGDELFGGYPRYQGLWLADLLHRTPTVARQLLQRLASLSPTRSARGVPLDRMQRFLAHLDERPEEMYFRWLAYMRDDQKEALLVDRAALTAHDPPVEPFEFLQTVRDSVASLDMPSAAALVDLQSFLPCNVLAYGDRMSMAHALEVRVPFCDHILVEQLAPVSVPQKLPFGVQKGLLRWSLRHDLPTRVATHRKIGFNPPISAWLRGPLAPMVDEYLDERSVRDRGIIKPRALATVRAEFAAGRGEHGHLIWALLILEAWMRWLST
jgi:asparagine synthase (glutamine-hydrolysing)